ncbi:IS66 family insertion sequence element accessory protein TnpB [Sorangium sp. So ce861]|uniref:IS66 family insertion sequence element accessory protein TnpB n=1 Tax=Sorangium sp. So ce861 TaxID=3133323 RepID=UPI003F5F9A0A
MRVYVAAEPTDLRKSFDGLSALVAQCFGADPLLCVVVRYVARRRSARGATRVPSRSLWSYPPHNGRGALHTDAGVIPAWTEATTCWSHISNIQEFSDGCAVGRSRTTSTASPRSSGGWATPVQRRGAT